jgi:hypothetical protein
VQHATSFTIDCDECVMRRTSACTDCVVTFVCEGADALVFDLAEARAVKLLAEAGLVSPLRHAASAAATVTTPVVLRAASAG